MAKLEGLAPKIPSFKSPDVGTGTVAKVQKTEEVKAPVQTPASQFNDATAKKTGVETGERADTAHAPAGSLGWDIADSGPLKFSGGGDVKSAQTAAQRALDGIDDAIRQIKGGADGSGTFLTAVKLSSELAQVIRDFADENPLLQATDLGALGPLMKTLEALIPKADAGKKELLEASATQLGQRGFVEVKENELKEPWNETLIARELAGKATTTPVFYRYFDKLLTVQPGDASTAEQRAQQGIEAYRNQPGDVAMGLRNALQTLARRVEVTQAQFAPVRTNEQITATSVEAAVKNGYPADGLPAKIGMAMQQLMNHQEIQQFAPQVLSLSLSTIDPKDEPDAGKRNEMALDRARYWVNNYGRNERDIDAVWSAALVQASAQLRA